MRLHAHLLAQVAVRLVCTICNSRSVRWKYILYNFASIHQLQKSARLAKNAKTAHVVASAQMCTPFGPSKGGGSRMAQGKMFRGSAPRLDSNDVWDGRRHRYNVAKGIPMLRLVALSAVLVISNHHRESARLA